MIFIRLDIIHYQCEYYPYFTFIKFQYDKYFNSSLDRALQVENSLNRFIAGLHPQLSAVQRDKLFYSDNWLDRLAIACNPSTSIEQLQILSQDACDLIKDGSIPLFIFLEEINLMY